MIHSPRQLAQAALTLAVTGALFSGSAQASTVLEQGRSYVHSAFYHQSFDMFWAGDTFGPNPGGDEIERKQFRVSVDYGLGHRLGADLSLAYHDTSSASFGPFSLGSQDGIADTYAGIRYAVTTRNTDGFDSTLRLGFTIPGDYETGQLSAPGDDAWGTDLRYAFQFNLATAQVETYLGYWIYEGAVPEAFGGGVTLKHGLGGGFWAEAGYHRWDASGGLDIGGPGFTPDRLPLVSEESDRWELALGYADSARRYYRVAYSKIFDGRNVGKEETWGFSIAWPF